MKSYRDLIVWQKSMALVTTVYEITRSFPDTECFGITQQIRRSVVSIPSNIAEGYGRNSKQDYIRFLKIARGSLFELQTQLEISSNLQYITIAKFEELYEMSTRSEQDAHFVGK